MGKLSIWIVGKDKGEYLPDCIESCRKLTGDITYLDLGSKDGSLDTAGNAGIRTERHPLSSPKTACKSDWTLFLRPNEEIVLAGKMPANLDREPSGYSLIIREELAPELLDDFTWMRSYGFSPQPGHSIFINKVEARLVRRRLFESGLKLMISRSPGSVSAETRLLNEVQIRLCAEEKKAVDPAESKKNQIRHLRGEILLDPKDTKEMNEFTDNFLSFGVLTNEDMERYYRGMEQGFGSERMYLIMLHYLNTFGRFDEAKKFFEKWDSSWEFFDTLDPYRAGGLIYAQLFELDKAIQYLKRYIDEGGMSNRAETLSALAKCLLLKRETAEGISMLEKALELRADDTDRRFLEAVKLRKGVPARLSVCIIARNESASLARALQSIRNLADEIVVIDTGSEDGTKEIAGKFGCKVADVPWKDDFSMARNAGLREVSGDYVLFLDADEFMDPRQRIRVALSKFHFPIEPDTAFTITIDQEEENEEMTVMLRLPRTDKPVFPIRLLPVRKDIWFEGTAFETPEKSLRASGLRIEWADFFKITHSCSDRQWRDERKKTAVRNAFTFIQEYNIALRGILYFLKMGDLEEALKWFRQSDFAEPRLQARLITFFVQHGVLDIRDRLEISRARFPNQPYLKLAAAELSNCEEKFEEIISILGRRDLPKDMERKDLARAEYLLGMALMKQNRFEEGIECMISARELEPEHLLYKIGGLYAMSKGRHWEGVIAAADNIFRGEGIAVRKVVAGLEDIAHLLVGLSEHFLNTGHTEESRIIRNIVEELIIDRKPGAAAYAN